MKVRPNQRRTPACARPLGPHQGLARQRVLPHVVALLDVSVLNAKEVAAHQDVSVLNAKEALVHQEMDLTRFRLVL